MINSLVFNGFRCFDILELKNLKPLVLISGKNNVGKTSVLEAIYFANKLSAPDSLIVLRSTRGIDLKKATPESLWVDFFHDRNLSSSFTITEEIDGTELEMKSFIEKDKDTSTIHLYASEKNLKPFKIAALITEISSGQSKGRVITEITSGNSIEHNVYGDSNLFARPDVLYLDTHRSHSGDIIESFGRIDIQGKSSKVIETLRLLDSSIKDLTVVVSDGMSQFFASLEGSEKKVPVKSMGDGLNRLLEMIVMIIANPDSIILVDEIENGFHYALHKDLWRVISKAVVLSNSQLFATTHSYECISAAAEAASEDSFGDKFAYIRVDKEGGGFFPRYYDSGLLLSAVSTEMEVR